MFNENSLIVKAWVKAVINGDKNVSEIPKLFNLTEVVQSIIKGGETDNV